MDRLCSTLRELRIGGDSGTLLSIEKLLYTLSISQLGTRGEMPGILSVWSPTSLFACAFDCIDCIRWGAFGWLGQVDNVCRFDRS